VFHQGPEFSIELYISTSEKERNEEIFKVLQDDRESIESNLGTELIWQQLPEKQACRIKWSRPIDGKITDLTTDQRAELIEWGINTMNAFQDELEPRVAHI